MTVSGAGGRPEPTAASSLAPLPLAWQRQVQPPQGTPRGCQGRSLGPGPRAFMPGPTPPSQKWAQPQKLPEASFLFKGTSRQFWFWIFLFLHLDIFKGSSLLSSQYVTIKKREMPATPHTFRFHQKEQMEQDWAGRAQGASLQMRGDGPRLPETGMTAPWLRHVGTRRTASRQQLKATGWSAQNPAGSTRTAAPRHMLRHHTRRGPSLYFLPRNEVRECLMQVPW